MITQEQKLRILFVEHHANDWKSAEGILRDKHISFTSQCVCKEPEYRKAIASFKPDLILSNYTLPAFSGLEALKIARERIPETPFIFFTDPTTEEIAVECMKAGAWDYVARQNTNLLATAVKSALEKASTERVQRDFRKELRESERKYKALIESSNDSIFIIQHGAIQYSNPELVSLSGYSKEELIGKNFIDFVAPEEVGKVLGYYKKRISGEDAPNKYESKARSKDNKIIDVEVSVIPIEYKGRPAEQVILRDISQKKKTIHDLKQSEERFRELANLLPEIIFEVDRDLNLIFGNSAIQKKLSISYSEFKEKKISIYDLVGDRDKERFADSVRRNFQGKESSGNIYEAVLRQGEIRYFQIFNSPIVRNNEIVGLRGIAVDVTDRKNAEKALAESEEKYRNIIDFAPVGFYQTTREGVLIMANKEMARMLGYENPKDLVSKNIKDFYYDPSYREKLIGKYDQDPEPKVKNEEVLLKKKNGEPLWVLLTARAIKDQNHVTLSYDGFVLDFSTTKKTQDELKESESKLSTIINNSMNGILVINDHYEFTFINDAISEILGYPEEEILHHDFRKFIHEDSLEVVAERYKIRQEGGNVPSLNEFDIVRKDGEKRRIEINATCIKDKEGKSQTVAQFVDVTERMKQDMIRQVIYCISAMSFKQEQLFPYLEKIHQEIRKLMKADNLYIAMYDKTTDTYTFPYDVDEVDEYRINEPIKLKGSLTDYVRRNGKGEIITEEDEEKIRQEDAIQLVGAPSPVWVGAPLINATSEEVIGVIAIQDYKEKDAYTRQDLEVLEIVAYNIGTFIERVKNLDMIKKAKEKAEESDRLKSAFLATMSHELRTPLNAILGFSSLILDECPKNEVADYARLINNSGDHLLKLIEGILDLTLIEGGQVSLKPETFHLEVFLTNILKILQEEQTIYNKQDIQVVFRPTQNIKGVFIRADKFKIQQVLVNLLKNALKYTDKGSIEFFADLVTKRKNTFLKLVVKDTGIGISKEDQQIIFDRFRQVDDSPTRIHDGVGIGLSVTKKIVELLKGNISLESKLGKGSSFTVVVPCEIKTSFQEVVKEEKQSYEWQGKKILLAEDQYSNYELVKAMLKPTGVEVLHAIDGKNTVEMANSDMDINLILMDIRMPVMNGLEATERIREFNPGIPIIALTAYAQSSDRERAKQAGCDGYMEKPLQKKKLMQMIQEYFQND